MRAFVPHREDKLTVDAYVDGQNVTSMLFVNEVPSGMMRIPLPANHNRQVIITLRTSDLQSPAALGLSADFRDLGVGLSRVTAE